MKKPGLSPPNRGSWCQKMAAPGMEMILGMTRDPHFGPLLMIGLGGTMWRSSRT